MNSLLIGKKAPRFTAKAVQKDQIFESFSLDQYEGKYVVFFFYPLDFTFVCPTELHAFEEKRKEFEERNCALVGCSIDSEFSHYSWLQMPKNQGGINGVEYPIVADLTKSIARDYHVLNEEAGVAFRGLFLMDKEGVVRHQLVNDLPLGRSVDEALRLLDALIFHETHGEVCPANWQEGKPTMKADADGLKQFFKEPVA